MNRVFLIVGVGLLIAALAVLNQGIKKASPTDQELEQQQEQAQKAAQTAQKAAQPPQPVTSAVSAVLPAEETVGVPATARHHIQVGWVYDEANQTKPETLTGPLQVVRDYVEKSGGLVSAEIVNIDVPAEDRSLAARAVTGIGITVDGKSVLTGNVSDAPVNAPQIITMLDAAVQKK